MVKKILISQPKPTSDKSPYFEIEREFGVSLVFRPFVQVEPITSKEFREQKVSIPNYTAIVFTSRHAIDHFFSLAKELRVPITEDLKYFCVTETIALYIQKYVQYRKRKVFFGSTGKMEDLLPLMVKHKQEKYLVPLSDNHTDDIANLLNTKKLHHTECAMYRTITNNFTPEEINTFDYDMLIFVSPTGVKSFVKDFPKFEQKDVRIGTFGPATSKAVTDEGLRLDFQAPSKEYPSMSSALKAYLEKSK